MKVHLVVGIHINGSYFAKTAKMADIYAVRILNLIIMEQLVSFAMF